MIWINLLSRVERDRLFYMLLWRAMLYATIVIALLLMTTFTVLSFVRYSVEQDRDALEKRLTLQNYVLDESNKQLIEDVKTLDALLQASETYIDQRILFSSIVSRIAGVAPPGIKLTQLRYIQASSGFELRGNAAHRTDLVSYLSALDTISYVENIESPVSNLTQEEDISFQLTFTINACARVNAEETCRAN
jgi:hypothetical protein